MQLRHLFPIVAVALAAPLAASAQQAVRMPLVQAGIQGAAAGPGAPVWQGANTFEFIAAGPAFGGEVVKDAPYSAEAVTETQQTLADGNRISRTNTSKIYRDSQGRTRREQQIDALGPWSSAGEPREIVFINDPVTGVNYVLNPADQTAQKTQVHVEMVVHDDDDVNVEAAEMRNRIGADKTAEVEAAGGNVFIRRLEHDVRQGEVGEQHDVTVVHSAVGAAFIGEDNLRTESLGTRTIEGVEADGTRTTTTIPAGQIGNELPIEIVSESWYSSQLQAVVLSTHNDPRMGQTTYRLANIQLVEPLPMLFDVPAGYTIQEGHNAQYIHRRVVAPNQGETRPGR